MHILQAEYSDYETGRRGIDLNKADYISSIYGLDYCELTNLQAPPVFDSLPKTTQDKILERQKSGIRKRDYTKQLTKKLDKIIFTTKILHTPANAQDILDMLPEEEKKDFSISLINKYLGAKPRKEKVVKTGQKKNGLTLYILREFMP